MGARLRYVAIALLSLVIGSTIGGIVALKTWALDIDEFQHNLWFKAFMFGVTGMLFAFLPYVIIGLPMNRLLERRIRNWMTRTMLLTIGGAATGAVITWTFAEVMVWASAVGGCTGMTLGLLRRHSVDLGPSPSSRART